MDKIVEILIVKPVAALVAWVTRHPVIASVVWIVIWFLPPLWIVLGALSVKAFGESIGNIFFKSRWTSRLFVLALVVFLPPVGILLSSWLLVDLFKPDDRTTTNTISEAVDQAKHWISAMFDRLKGRSEPPTVPAGEAPTMPPPNPVVGGEIIVNPNVGVDGTSGDFGGLG